MWIHVCLECPCSNGGCPRWHPLMSYYWLSCDLPSWEVPQHWIDFRSVLSDNKTQASCISTEIWHCCKTFRQCAAVGWKDCASIRSYFCFRFHWNLFLKVQVTVSQHWLRWWHGTEQLTSHATECVTSHYLKQGCDHVGPCWVWVTHICVSKLTIIGSDNGLSPGRRQAIIWTNAGILLIWTLGTNFIEIWIGILSFSF